MSFKPDLVSKKLQRNYIGTNNERDYGWNKQIWSLLKKNHHLPYGWLRLTILLVFIKSANIKHRMFKKGWNDWNQSPWLLPTQNRETFLKAQMSLNHAQTCALSGRKISKYKAKKAHTTKRRGRSWTSPVCEERENSKHMILNANVSNKVCDPDIAEFITVYLNPVWDLVWQRLTK